MLGDEHALDPPAVQRDGCAAGGCLTARLDALLAKLVRGEARISYDPPRRVHVVLMERGGFSMSAQEPTLDRALRVLEEAL